MTSLRRWLKRECHRCMYMRNYLAKVSLLLFVGGIIMLQFHTLITSRSHTSNHMDNNFRLRHHDDDDNFDYDVPHYVLEVGAHSNRVLQRNDRDAGVVLNRTDRAKLSPQLRNTHYLKMKTQGRLGNNMFTYAALLGIAKENYMIPLLPEDSDLRKFFYISSKVTNTNQAPKRWTKFSSEKASTFDKRSFMLNYTVDIELAGYFQSWRYFAAIRDQILREFTFHHEIQTFAENVVQNLVYQSLGVDTLLQELTYVGIHVRRGDMLEPHNIEKGFTVAPREYLLAAIKYFEDRYDPAKMVFIVCSDDMVWVRANLRRHRAPIVYSLFHEPAQDLAVLAQCHHVITTVGTFSWWAGYMSTGTVIYYKDFPRPGSQVDKAFSHDDYYPSHWIGIGSKDL